MSHTYVILYVSIDTFEEIYTKLETAGYQQAFHDTADGFAIDMHGIAIQVEKVKYNE